MHQQSALGYARDLISKGMSAADANVAVVRMMGVRLVSGSLTRDLRAAYMAGVKDGRLGHLKKDGSKPEAFYHPNSECEAKAARSRAESATIRALLAVCG